MFRGKESIFVTLICAAGMGMFVALWLLDFAIVRITACDPEESRGLCLRGWIGALSGWAAAIGALVAAGLTIDKLKEQIADQKRQTDFIIGDGLPTFDAIEHIQHSNVLVTRIVNWNRSTIIVRLVQATGTDAIVTIDTLTIDKETKESKNLLDLDIEPFALKGWEDRNNAPHSAEIRLTAYEYFDDDFHQRKTWTKIPKIYAKVQILGAQHRMVTLEADTGIIE